MIFPNFKVLDVIFEVVGYALIVKGNYPNILQKIFYIVI
jgi:hypothetical protein